MLMPPPFPPRSCAVLWQVGAPDKLVSVSQLNFRHEKIKAVELFEKGHKSQPGTADGEAGADFQPEAPKKSVFEVIEKHEEQEHALEDAIKQEEEADAEEERVERAREAAELKRRADEAAEAARLAAEEAAREEAEAAEQERRRLEAEELAAMDPLHFEVAARTS